MKWLPALIAAFAFTAFGADPTGSWTASIETPSATIESTFTFKVSDGKLSGTVKSTMGDSEITDAKLDGDNISFAVVHKISNQEFRLNYKGAVGEKEMKLTLTIPSLFNTSYDVVAKKKS